MMTVFSRALDDVARMQTFVLIPLCGLLVLVVYKVVSIVVEKRRYAGRWHTPPRRLLTAALIDARATTNMFRSEGSRTRL